LPAAADGAWPRLVVTTHCVAGHCGPDRFVVRCRPALLRADIRTPSLDRRHDRPPSPSVAHTLGCHLPLKNGATYRLSRILDESGSSLASRERESPGKRGPLCWLAAHDHRKCGRTHLPAKLTLKQARFGPRILSRLLLARVRTTIARAILPCVFTN
jgi:hypothetical protein